MKKTLLNILSSAIRCHRSYLILCMILFPFVVFFAFSKPWELRDDFWEVAATVRELSNSLSHPSNPILLLPGNTCLRFVPYTIFWGFFKRISGLGIFTIMGLAGIVNYFIFIFGLYHFVSKRFKDTFLPTYTLLTMFILWGSGYEWANVYSLGNFFIIMSDIGFFTFGLSLHALYFLNCYCENSKWENFLWYLLLSVIAFISHPLVGAFCFVSSLAILLEYGNLKRVLFLQSVPLLAFGVSLFWPYFSYWDIFTKGTTILWFESPLFSGQVKALGMSIVGFPIVIFYALKRKYLFLLYGLLFCSFIYIISAFKGIIIGGRFLIFSVFFLHLAIGVYIKQYNIFNWQKIKDSLRTNGLLIIFIFMLLIPAVVYRANEMKKHIFRFFDTPFQIHSYASPVKPYLFLSDYLSPSDIVLVDEREGWVIPAFTGARLVATRQLNPLAFDEEQERKKDVERFFKSQLSQKERLELIDKYQVTHIMINLKNEKDLAPSFIDAVKVIGIEKVREGVIVLYLTRRE